MANGGLIGALRVTLGLDSAQFEAGTKRARNVAKRDVGEIQRVMGGAKMALGGLATAATAAAFAAAAKRALDYAGGLGELAQQAGVSTKALQEYAAVGVEVGLTNDDIVSSFARLSKTIGAAQDGNKKASETFRQLGIDVTGLTAESAMPKLIAAFERIKSPTDQARIASELFGRTAGAKLLPLLNMTTKGFEEARQAAHDLGMVLTDDAIRSADAASDALAKLTKVTEVNFAQAMVGGADSVSAMAGEIAKMVAALPRQIESIRQFAFSAADALRVLGPYGDFVADKARRAQSVGLDNKAFVQEMRRTKERIKQNPNDAEAVSYGQYLLGQVASRRKRGSSPTAVSTANDFTPRTERDGGGKKGGGRDRSSDYLERFNRELAGLQDEQLSLQQDITTDVRERARLEHLRIETEQAAYNFDLDQRTKSGELTAAQAEQLRLQYEANAQKQKTIVNWQLDDQLTEQELDLKRAAVDLENDRLKRELDGARTQEERRRIQLRILENEMELERAALEAVKAKHKSTDVEYQIADAKLGQLAKEGSARAAEIGRNTMGPWETYLSDLPKTADEIRERFEAAAVDGVGSLKDGLAEAILEGKSLGDVLDSALKRFQARLLDLALDQAFQALLGGGSGSGGGGILSAIGGLFSGGGSKSFGSSLLPFSIPKMANGGSFMVGGMPGIDRNVLAINGIPRAMVSSSERINVNPANDRGRGNTYITLTNSFVDAALWGKVEAIAAGKSAEVVGLAGRRMARRNDRRTG